MFPVKTTRCCVAAVFLLCTQLLLLSRAAVHGEEIVPTVCTLQCEVSFDRTQAKCTRLAKASNCSQQDFSDIFSNLTSL